MSLTCTVPIFMHKLIFKHLAYFVVELVVGHKVIIDPMLLPRPGLSSGETEHQTEQLRILVPQVIDYGALAHPRGPDDDQGFCAFARLHLQPNNNNRDSIIIIGRT